MNKIYLPKFAGQSNPYDVLWYLSLEIGRTEMLKAYSIGTLAYEIQSESEKAMREKYDTIAQQLLELTDEEREFLRNDSKTYGRDNVISETSDTLQKMSYDSLSDMSLMHSWDSEKYLCATLGEEEGKAETNRRVQLILKFRDIDLTEDVCKQNNLSDDDVNLILTDRELRNFVSEISESN